MRIYLCGAVCNEVLGGPGLINIVAGRGLRVWPAPPRADFQLGGLAGGATPREADSAVSYVRKRPAGRARGSGNEYGVRGLPGLTI